MYLFKIKIAGVVCEISTIHVRPLAICRDFIVDLAPDCNVSTTQEDIDEDKMHLSQFERENSWDGVVEIYSVLRKVAEKMIDFNAILMHGAVVAVDGNAYLFTANSGVGKTTHILKWYKNCDKSIIINGDKPFIKFGLDGEQPLVCGSPWAGKETIYTNTMVPLKSIILMERSSDNYIEPISFAKAFPFLLQQTFRSDDEEKMRKTLQLMKRMSSTVTFWHFYCNNFKADCFDVAYSALVRNQP